MSLPRTGVWPRVCKIIDAHPDPDGLRAHGLVPIAVAHWRELERPISDELDAERITAGALLIEAERLVRVVRESCDESFLVIKGPDVASRFPDPTLRVLNDLDLLARDAERMHARLRSARWVEFEGPSVLRWYDDLHHAHPLVCPGMSLPVELHRRPNWPTWASPPSFDELLSAANPSALNIEGVFAPCVEHHALLVLAHSWAGQPFEQLSQLVDFALLLEECDITRLQSTAKRWQLGSLLEVGVQTVDSILLGRGDDPRVVRYFASHLRDSTSPTPQRRQLNRYAASFAVTSPAKAARSAGEGLGRRARTIERDLRSRNTS